MIFCYLTKNEKVFILLSALITLCLIIKNVFGMKIIRIVNPSEIENFSDDRLMRVLTFENGGTTDYLSKGLITAKHRTV